MLPKLWCHRSGSSPCRRAHLGMLQELALSHCLLYHLPGGEVVVHAILLPGAGPTRGVADAEAKAAGMVRHEPGDEGALAHAAGAADDHGRLHLGHINLAAEQAMHSTRTLSIPAAGTHAEQLA